MLGLRLSFVDKGGGDGKLTLSQKVHSNRAVYEGLVRLHGILGGRQVALVQGGLEGPLEVPLGLVDISDAVVEGIEVLADGVLQLGEGETCSVRVVGWC